MKLSIITINYNNKAGLEKTIASVMAQTWRSLTPSPSPKGEGSPWEWIIIDGGSTDGSAEVIAELAKKPEANISYWCSEPDGGIYYAMNKGLDHTHGEYVQFLNSGDMLSDKDVLHNVFLQTSLSAADVIYGDARAVFSNGKILEIKSGNDLTELRYHPVFRHGASFVRTPLQKKFSFDVSRKYLGYALDYLSIHRMYMYKCSYYRVDAFVLDYQAEGVSDNLLSNFWYNFLVSIDSGFNLGCLKRFLMELKNYYSQRFKSRLWILKK